MSAFIEGQVSITCEEDLLAALCEMGIQREHIEVHAEPQHLFGYKNDRRPEVAHIIVRRQHLTRASNDIGFLREGDKYTAIVSQYDSQERNGKWVGALDTKFKSSGGVVNEVATRSAICAAERKAKAKGFKTTRKQQGRKVTLLMERM